MERAYLLEVELLVETNKSTYRERYRPREDETLADLLRRLADEVDRNAGFPPA